MTKHKIHTENKTALLLFTRSAEQEAVVKDFSEVHSFHTNLSIVKNLISHSEKTARASGLPCFTISSSEQIGNSFGEKLSNAFEAIYQLGFENVIAIGNDCPTLCKTDLQYAAQSLQNKNAILGPAADGGLYLIGIQRKFFDRTLFEEIPWGSNLVENAFIQYLTKAGADFSICETKDDLDYQIDLIKILRNNYLSFSLRKNVAAIIASIKSFCSTFSRNPLSVNFRKYSLYRGPPVY